MSSSRASGSKPRRAVLEEEVEEIVDRKAGQTYFKGRLLGKGGFAKCYKFQHAASRHVCAGKCVEKASLKKERARRKLLSEIKIHRSLAHKNVVRFEHYFEDSKFVYILLEYCNNQTLMELVRRKKRLGEGFAKGILLQLLDGVEYLQSMNVIHRDLKLGNIFLTNGTNVRIGDFGLATRLEHANERKKTMCGTPNYIAPEILDGKSGHSFEVDIWSIGVILYTMLVGKPPFETKNVKQTYKRIQANLYSFPAHVELSTNAKFLIRAILNRDPAQRPSLRAMRAHPFFYDTDKENAAFAGNQRRATRSPALSLASSPSGSPAAAAARHQHLQPQSQPHKKGSRTPLGQSKRHAARPAPLSTSTPRSAQRSSASRGSASRGSAGRSSPASAKASAKASPADAIVSPTRRLAQLDLGGGGGSRSPRGATDSPRNDSSRVFVHKWVDYTSKYGLGYILRGGIVGVYFNDSTKLVVSPNRRDFQYYERGVATFSSHTIDGHPDALHKKVTLLKHFRSYLEKRSRSDGGISGDSGDASQNASLAPGLARSEAPEEALPFVKKWVRTRHAIFFRLSNRTVQVAFFDDTQILLSAQAKMLTYFDKHHNERSILLADAKAYPDISKRLKYTKDVLHQLIASGNTPTKR